MSSLNQRQRGGPKKSVRRTQKSPSPQGMAAIPAGFKMKKQGGVGEKMGANSNYTIPTMFATPAAASPTNGGASGGHQKSGYKPIIIPSPPVIPVAPVAKEGKAVRRRSKEKAEEKKVKESPPPMRKSTNRPRKKTVPITPLRSSTPTPRTPTTVDSTKTEDIPLVPVKSSKSCSKNKKKSGSIESKHSWEHKSSSSKDSEEEKRTKRERDLALTYYKDLQSRRQTSSRRNLVDSFRLEVMPESSQLGKSVRAIKTRLEKTMKPSAEVPEKEPELFKPNGDPFWLNTLPPAEDDELHTLLATADMKIEEKTWADVVAEFLDGKLQPGPIMELAEQHELDPFAEMEEMRQSDECLSIDTVNFLTARTIHETCYESVNRYRQKHDREEDRGRNHSRSKESSAKTSSMEKSEEPPLKTCYGGITTFDLTRNVNFSYDRRCPIASAQALTRKKSRNEVTKTETEGH